MQTFLTIVGILFAVGLVGFIVLAAQLRKLAARGSLFLLKEGMGLINGKANEPYVTPELRTRIDALNTRMKDLPAKASIWNAGTIVGALKPMILEMASIGKELEQLAAEDEQAKAGAITVEATDVTPTPPLALLPAPEATLTEGKSNEAILADFRREFVEHGNCGVVDAWLTGSGDDVFIQYQLSLDVADKAMETGKLTDVPMEYQGLPTLITWFPREK
jgi:hypothetical protein